MADTTSDQSKLGSYAEAVLRQNGIKDCRIRWVSTDVLTIEVNPTRVDKARTLLPVIQQRAGQQVHVRLHQPSSDNADVKSPANPFDT
jgi:hypothetical protein